MEKFSKLFETKEYGQILVLMKDDDKCKPEVRIFVKPPKLGVCSIAFGWKDDDAGWDLAEACFAKTDEAKAREYAASIFKQVKATVDTNKL